MNIVFCMHIHTHTLPLQNSVAYKALKYGMTSLANIYGIWYDQDIFTYINLFSIPQNPYQVVF